MATALHAFATFRTDLPDDAVEENDVVVKTGGENIMEHLRSGLAARGLAPTPVEPHSYYGWAFEVPVDGVTIWCMIQGAEKWLLITEVRSRLVQRLLGRRPDKKHEALLRALAEIMAAPPFREAKWKTRPEYEG